MKKEFQTLYEALKAAVEDQKGTVDLDSKKFFIVPDKISLTAERMFCESRGGVIDTEITSFSSLIRKYILKGKSMLSRQGSVMLLKRIAEEKQSELKCYTRSSVKRGFAGKLYETIRQLSEAEITPEKVSLRYGNEKAEDISLIYGEYTRRLEEKSLSDMSGCMNKFREYVAEGTLFDGADVVFACFEDMSRQMLSIKKEIEKKAASVTEYCAKPKDIKLGAIKLEECVSQVEIAKKIAKRIACLIKVENVSPEKICVLTADSNPYELRRIFKENGIPFSASEPLKLSRHPLGQYVSLALRSSVRGYKAADVIALSKCAFLGLDIDWVEDFERYVQKFGIKYKGFFEEFNPGDQFFEGAERVRRKLERILTVSGSMHERITSLMGEAVEFDVAVTKENEGRANAFKKLNEISELAADFLGGADPKIAIDAVIDAMDNTELSSRPKRRNAVDIGTEDELKARQYDYVFVNDFTGNNHPATVHEDGLLSDEDIAELNHRHSGMMISTIDVNRRNKEEFYYVLMGAKQIELYGTSKSARIMDELRSKSNCTFTEINKEGTDTSVTDAAAIIEECPTKNMLLEKYLTDSKSLIKAAENDEEARNYLNFVKSAIGDIVPEKNEAPDEISGIEQIMISDQVAPSLIEMYASCPRKYYFQRALRAKKIDDASIDRQSVGTIIHRVAELYIGKMDDSPDIELLLDTAIDESGKIIKDYDRDILLAEARELCAEILRQRDIGRFVPIGSEVAFGTEDAEYPPIEITVAGKKMKIVGKIDRVDTAELEDGTRFVRVFDYKTGSPKLNDKLIKKGRTIQLPVYLAAVRGKEGRPVAAFYFPTQKSKGSYKLLGICDISDEHISAMNDKGQLIEFKLTKSGKVVKTQQAGLIKVDEAGMKEIIEKSIRFVEQAAGEIHDGFIKPSPAEKRLCDYCDYRACCEYTGNGRASEGSENEQ